MSATNKIDTKVFVPTQKSIVKVIDANVEAMSKITDVVLKAILSSDISNLKNNKKTETYLNNFEQVFIGKNNILLTIVKASENIARVGRISKLDTIIFKHNTDAIINCYSYILQAIKEFNATNVTETVFESFIYALSSMNNVIYKTNLMFKYNLGNLVNLKFRLWKLKLEIKVILKSFNNMITDFAKISVDKVAIELFRANVLPLIDVIDKISELILKLAYLKVPVVRIKRKIRRIKNILWALVFTFSKLALTVLFTPFVSLSMLTISQLSFVVSLTANIFETLDNMPVGPKAWIKILMLNKSLNDLKSVFITFNESINILNSSKFAGSVKDYGKTFLVITMISVMMHMIAELPTQRRIKRRIKGVIFGIDGLQTIFRKLHSIKINQGKSNALKKAVYALLVVSALSLIFSQILLMTPILILTIPAMLLFIGGVLLLKLVIHLTSKILLKALPKMLLIMLVIGVVISMFTAISVMFLFLALVAKPIVLATGWILLMLGVITLVAVGIVLIGTLAAMAIPFLLAGIAGFAILSLAVIALTAVAAALLILQSIKLNREDVTENVNVILDTAQDIIYKLYSEEEKDDRARYEKRWDRRDNRKTFGFGINGIFGKHIGSVLNALTSFAVLVTTVLSVTVIFAIATMLKLLQVINLQHKNITDNVALVLSTAKSIMKSIFDDEESKDAVEESEKTKKKNIFNMIGDAIINHIDVGSDIIKIIKSVGSVAYLVMTLASVGLIVVIASLLRILQELNLNTVRITSNVDLVLSTVNSITDKLFNVTEPDTSPTKKPWLNRVIHNIGKPITDIFDAIMSIGFLAVSIGSIALINVLARQLNKLSTIEIASDVQSKVNNIIFACQSVADAIFNRPDTMPDGQENPKKKGLLRRLLSGIWDGVEMIASMGWLSTALISVGMVGKLAEHLKSINSLPDLSGIDKKTVAICNAADKVIDNIVAPSNKTVTNTSRLSILERVNTALIGFNSISSEQIENNTKAVDNYVRFIDKVNTVEVSKLEKSAQMFKQMANFSNSIKGNFEKLAESINEDLMPVLEELKEIMEKVPTAIETNGANVSAAVASTTVAPTTTNVTKQVERENPGMDKKQVEQLVQARLREHANSAANSTASKIDELISLLKGYSGEHVIVQTV